MMLKYSLLCLCAFCLWAPSAGAYNFEPTDAEFLAWPSFCRVAYVRSGIGSRSKFASAVSSGEVSAANSVLGSQPFGGVGVHHYCAGGALLSRAQTEVDPVVKRRQLDHARRETEYTFTKTPPGHYFFPLAAIQMAYIRYEQGNHSDAIRLLDSVIDAHPEDPTPYSAKAIIHFRKGEFHLARQVLIEGNARTDGGSSEIHYNLGLVLLEVNEPALAAQHAKKAYELGYPLPGLRQRLERIGYWNRDL
jgi:hypothetical protein